MLNTIITCAITTLTGTIIGFLISALKESKAKMKKNKEENKIQSEALKILLQNALTNIYFVYEKIGEIPDYAYKNWTNMLKIYESLDGDDYIHVLDEKMKTWRIITTGVLIGSSSSVD